MSGLNEILLPVRREGLARATALVFVPARPIDESLAASCLHENEQSYWRRISHPSRKADFLLGRLAAKTALARLGVENALKLEIAFGAFGQPLARVPGTSHEVSIAHSAGGALAIAFPAGESLAVDFEEVSQEADRLESLRRQMTDRERALVAPLGEAVGLAVLWVAKEALSKALRCGITTPFRLLEAETIAFGKDGVELTFRHFGQYRALVRYSPRFAQALCLPLDSTLALDDFPRCV